MGGKSEPSNNGAGAVCNPSDWGVMQTPKKAAVLQRNHSCDEVAVWLSACTLKQLISGCPWCDRKFSIYGGVEMQKEIDENFAILITSKWI